MQRILVASTSVNDSKISAKNNFKRFFNVFKGIRIILITFPSMKYGAELSFTYYCVPNVLAWLSYFFQATPTPNPDMVLVWYATLIIFQIIFFTARLFCSRNKKKISNYFISRKSSYLAWLGQTALAIGTQAYYLHLICKCTICIVNHKKTVKNVYLFICKCFFHVSDINFIFK